MSHQFDDSTGGWCVIRMGSNPATHAMDAHQRQAFWRADHLVEQWVHEVQRALELAIAEVAPPHFQGNALGGVPSVRTEANRTGEPFDPKPGLSQVFDGTRLCGEGGVEGEGHGLEFQRVMISDQALKFVHYL